MKTLHQAANLHLFLKKNFPARIGPLWTDDSWAQKMVIELERDKLKNQMYKCGDPSFYRHIWEMSFYKNEF